MAKNKTKSTNENTKKEIAKLSTGKTPQATSIYKELNELYKLLLPGIKNIDKDTKEYVVKDIFNELNNCLMGVVVSYNELDLETKLQGISELLAHVQKIQSLIMVLRECGNLLTDKVWFGSMECMFKIIEALKRWSYKIQNKIKNPDISEVLSEAAL